MEHTKKLLYCALLLIGCFLLRGELSADDNALVYVIDIRTEIGGGVSTYIKKGIQKAEKANADAIIFDVDTPGGKVDSALNIVRSIQRTQIPTIAFVNRQAISAGAMISAACTQIVMVSGGAIGDVAPVDVQGNEAGEKSVSFIRTTMRSIVDSQQISPRNPDIAEAMVDKSLVLVRLVENGDIIKLRPEEYLNQQAIGTKMEILCAKGELLTLTTLQALDYGFAETQAETLTDLLSKYQIVRIGESSFIDRNNIVTMALNEKDFLRKQEELGVDQVTSIKSLENAKVTKFKVTLADHTVFFLTSPYISALLLSLGGLGLLIEIRTPGFGIPGFLGLLFIGLFFGGHMLNEVPNAYLVALIFVVGLALIVLEVFVIPGFGVAGILGLMLMLGSVFYTFFQNTDDISVALLWLSISIITTSVLAIFATIFLPKSSPFQRLALSTVMSADLGYHSTGADFQSFLGKTGVALTPLRPAGTAKIDNKRLDVVTFGDFIAQNTPIRVLEVEGSKISVEVLEE